MEVRFTFCVKCDKVNVPPGEGIVIDYCKLCSGPLRLWIKDLEAKRETTAY